MSYRDVRWQDDAACRGMPLEIFFPGQNDTGARAKKICATCKVKDECLRDARGQKYAYGVWGGIVFGRRLKS